MNKNIKAAWSQEYKRKGIPSSYRQDPTRVVAEFINWLKATRDYKGGFAADIGCGLGRNSFFLVSQGFKVVGIELLEDNVKTINAISREKNLPIHAYAQDASSPWPIPPFCLDLVIDVFCYKHIVDKDKQKLYRVELSKSLKTSGIYFISLASEKDGFYGPLLNPDMSNKHIIDPHSNIPSFLYSIEDLQREFSDLFEVIQINEQISTSPMYGKDYKRVVINAVLKAK
jgi:SAM-dependent methyltransferase